MSLDLHSNTVAGIEKDARQMPVEPNTYCYNEDAKQAFRRKAAAFYRAVRKTLEASGAYSLKISFNAGGIAVWGDNYARITLNGLPVVELFTTRNGVCTRQWDGRNSGMNCYPENFDAVVSLIRTLADRPFVRF